MEVWNIDEVNRGDSREREKGKLFLEGKLMNVFLIQMFMEEQMKLFKPDGHLRPASFPSQDGVQGQNGEAQPLGWVCSSGL